MVGKAFTALAWGYTMERIGRRRGLAMGPVVDAIGAGIAGSAVIARSFPLFLLGMVVESALVPPRLALWWQVRGRLFKLLA